MRLINLSQLPDEGVSHNPEIRKKVMVRAGVVPHLTGFSRSALMPGQVARAHAHADMHEIFFVANGEGTISINDSKHAIGPGTCIVVEPGETHEISNSGQTELVLFYFGIESH